MKTYRCTNYDLSHAEMIDDLMLQLVFDGEEFNGHLQTTVSSISLTTCLALVKLIDESGRVKNWCDVRLYQSDGIWSASFYSIDHWNEGEHPNNHTDKLLLSVENVTGIE